MTLPRGFGVSAVGAGGDPRSNNGKNIFFVFRSRVMFRAPGAVFTVSSTLYLSGDSCWMTETVPSPLEVYIRRVSGSYAESSGPGPIGTELIKRPLFESRITRVDLRIQ